MEIQQSASRLWRCLLALGAAGLVAHLTSAPLAAQPHAGEYSTEDVQRGEQLFSTRCTNCHGDAGDQVPGVRVLSGSFRRVSTDEELSALVRNGIPDRGMPQGNYNADELRAIVAYLRTAASSTPSSSVSLPPGDPVRGKALFESKAGCLACHRTAGDGGFRGPNLSTIGAVRSEASLVDSLINPSAEIVPLNQELRVVTRTGRTIEGRRMNEDTFSVQLILAEQGRLVSLLKSEVREIVPLPSPMPSFRDRLTAGELSDIVAYLRSLTVTN